MPKINMNVEELRDLFNKINCETDNFLRITSLTLADNPKYIRIFRFILGMSLKKFSKLINKSYATISQYERGNIKIIPKTEARNIVEILRRELPEKIDFSLIETNFERFYKLSRGGQQQGILRAELGETTKQEEAVESELKKLNIKFDKHKTLDTDIGPLNFDFWIPSKN